MWAATWEAAVRAVGALALRLGSLPTDDKAAEIAAFRPTALVATPAYLDRLAAALRAQGHSAGAVGVSRVLIATQSVSIDWVRRTEATWGAQVFEWYGNASGFFAMTCRAGVAPGGWGTLHWDPAFQLLEIVDSAGVPVAPRRTGELVGTHLANSSAPLIRYQLGDEAGYVAPRACSCGAAQPGLRAGSIRRADGMVKFRGVSLWPAGVDRALDAIPGVDSSWVVLRDDAQASELAELFIRPARTGFDYDRAAAAVRLATGVRFTVVPWESDEPPGACRAVAASGKTPRWVDLRRHGAKNPTTTEEEQS